MVRVLVVVVLIAAVLIAAGAAAGPAHGEDDVWTPVKFKTVSTLELGDLRSPTLRGTANVSDIGIVNTLVRGVAIPLGKHRAFLLDLDRDNVFGNDGDGYVAPESRTVGPWTGEAWTATIELVAN